MDNAIIEAGVPLRLFSMAIAAFLSGQGIIFFLAHLQTPLQYTYALISITIIIMGVGLWEIS
jgi:hypothetical protein